MNTFDKIPDTAKELRSLKDFHGLNVYETLSRLRELENIEAEKISIPELPSRPSNHTFYKRNNEPTSKELKVYADSIEWYEKKKAKYDKAWSKRRKLQKNTGPLMEEFIKLESGFYDQVPKKSQDKVYKKAYEDGHSCGYHEVYNELIDLIEIFND